MLALVQPNKIFYWHGLDLRWVYSDLLKYIFFHTKCIHAAQDVLHDALLRFAFSKQAVQADEPHAYLRTVVRHLLVDNVQLASKFVPLNESLDNPVNHYLLENPDANWANYAASPEKILDLQQRLQAVQHIINCLPAKCREVFWLFRIEGLRQSEIAAKLDISLNMVERHVIRALVDIRAARDQLT